MDLRLILDRYNTPDSLALLSIFELEELFNQITQSQTPMGRVSTTLLGLSPDNLSGLDGIKKSVLLELKQRDSLPKVQSDGQPQKTDTKGFTKARQTAAMLFIFEFLKVERVDKTEIARFIEFVTGKNYQNIYEQVIYPGTDKRISKARRSDLQFIRPFFDNLGLREIVKMIDNELDKPLEKNL
jgi:hypothetical protein